MKKPVFLIAAIIIISVSAAFAQQWESCNNGIKGSNIQSLEKIGNILFAASAEYGVFFSTDYGDSWNEANSGLGNLNVISLKANGHDLLTGAGGGVFLSADSGKNWAEISSGLPDDEVFDIIMDGANIFAATFGNGIYLSTDYGKSWHPKNSGLTNKYINRLAFQNSLLFAATTGAGVFYSDDYGENWHQSGLRSCRVYGLEFIGSEIFAAVKGEGGVLMSSDKGETWKRMDDGLSFQWGMTFQTCGPAIFTGTWGGGVFLSVNNGRKWEKLNTGLTDMNILSFAVLGHYIFAGTQKAGVFRMDISYLCVNDKKAPDNIDIYPNPADDFVNIDCSDNHIKKIRVYSITGSKEIDMNFVRSLRVNMLSPGIHLLVFYCGSKKVIKRLCIMR